MFNKNYSNQHIKGDLVVTGIISGTTYYGDASGLSNLPEGLNFATGDLTLTNNRTHDFSGYTVTFDNAELKITSEGNTSGDTPFEVRQTDGTTSILKVTGDNAVAMGTGSFTIQPLSGNADFLIKSAGSSFRVESSNNLTLGGFTADNFGNFYVQNTANGGFLHLRTTGTSGVIDISSSGIIRILNGLPSSASLANQLVKVDRGDGYSDLRIKN